MVRKLRDIASEHAGPEPAAALADAIRESAEKIWLAGLGAFAGARRDPGGAFEALIRDGLALQARTREAADERLQAARRDVAGRAAQSWDRLERVFEQRIATTLERIGMPSAAHLQALEERIEALAAQVRSLEAASRPARAMTKRSTTARKPTAPKTPTPETAARKNTARRSTPRKTAAQTTGARKTSAR